MTLKTDLEKMISCDYIIARHRIRVEGLRLVYAMGKLRGFDIFIDRDHGDPVCIFSEASGVPDISPECHKLYADSKDGFQSVFVRKPDGGYIFDSSSEKGERIIFETDALARKTKFYGDYTEELLRFALWLAYGLAVVNTLTLSLHASTILYKDKVVLFLGESGTGKSTHTRIWTQSIEGSQLFNDDSPILRVEEGKIIVYGGPWSGKTPCYRKESYPLAACVRLSQAPHNKIFKLPKLQAYAALHPSCPPEFAYDDRLYDFVSEFLGDLISSVPVFRMECLPDKEAAKLSCETIFGSCNLK